MNGRFRAATQSAGALRVFCVTLLLLGTVLLPARVHAASEAEADGEGAIRTLWPLLDYRESPRDRFRSLSLLGPVILRRESGDQLETAFRPFLYRTTNRKDGSVSTDFLYPLASWRSSPGSSRFQVLRGLLTVEEETGEGGSRSGSMLFPFYISGESPTRGRYTSFFPVYGTLYDRLGRDEIEYFLFPLYGRTVKGTTVTRNFLYPFFSVTEGEKEKGFAVWPLYGSSAKEGAYNRTFALWPIFSMEKSALDTADPVSKLTVFPLYASTESAKLSSRRYLWPFFGREERRDIGETRIDYLWPLIGTVRGEKRNVNRVLPFYSRETADDYLEQWYLWPLYRREEIRSADFSLQRTRLLFFLYSDLNEAWTADGRSRRKTALWPLFLYRRDDRGVATLSVPAPVEPVLDADGIEKSWAPLWRLFVRKSHEAGDSAMSVLWNLYWHERRGDSLAYELFPLISYRKTGGGTEIDIFKGLLSVRRAGETTIGLLWFPAAAPAPKRAEGQ